MAEDTWYTVSLPVLEYIHEHTHPMDFLSVGEIADGTGIDPMEVATEVDRLHEARYLRGGTHRMLTGGDPSPWFIEEGGLAERGLRTVGAWPSDDPYDALVALLERQIVATDDPEKKSKLSRLVTSLGDVGKATVAGLLVEFAKGNIRF